MDIVNIPQESPLMKQIADVRIAAFDMAAKCMIKREAEYLNKEYNEVYDFYDNNCQDLCLELFQKIFDLSEWHGDQLIYYHMILVTIAVNISGLLDWEQALEEIDQLEGVEDE